MKTFNVPLLLLGGGGYTVRNVARCWAYETGLALDTAMADELPYNQYYEYYGPDFNLHIQPSNMENLNTPNYLQKQETFLLQALKDLPHAPSVQYSYQPPRDDGHEAREEIEKGKREHESMRDVRTSQIDADKSVADRREFYADDKDQDGTTMPAKVTNQLNASSSATGAAAAAGSAAAMIAPSINQAAPAFQPNTALNAAGAPGISAPLATPMDTQ
ncbi:MAG: hypothetical protein Q7T57_07530 [Dehalococcoidales bacterium]|nr:hypothetical protein [Dehalococcoidales bacterium]